MFEIPKIRQWLADVSFSWADKWKTPSTLYRQVVCYMRNDWDRTYVRPYTAHKQFTLYENLRASNKHVKYAYYFSFPLNINSF